MRVLLGKRLHKLFRPDERQTLQFYVSQLLGDVVRGGTQLGDVRLGTEEGTS